VVALSVVGVNKISAIWFVLSIETAIVAVTAAVFTPVPCRFHNNV